MISGRSLVGVVGAALALAPVAGAATIEVYGSAPDNEALAQRTAPALLASLPALPGATPSPVEPPDDAGALSPQLYTPLGVPHTVVADRWSTTSTMTPSAALADAAANLPDGVPRQPSVTIGGGDDGALADGWELPGTAGLNARAILIVAAPLPGGRTGVRESASATWTTPRPDWDRVPSPVRSVEVTGRARAFDDPFGPRSSPVTLRGARARALASFLDTLPAEQPSVPPKCAVLPLQETLTLRVLGPGGALLARAVERPVGSCEATVSLSPSGREGPLLADAGGRRQRTSVSDRLIAAHAFPMCRAADLVAGEDTRSIDAHPGQLVLSLVDRTARACVVDGFPRVVLRDVRARAIPMHQVDADRRDAAAPLVLFPRLAADVTVSYRSCPHATPVASAGVRLRGGGPADVNLPVGVVRQRPCPHGRLRVTAPAPASVGQPRPS